MGLLEALRARIGAVGRTGNATACLLHFELWSAPGWYEGGSAFDPVPQLKAWDRETEGRRSGVGAGRLASLLDELER